ncbi:alpha/beta hydrolase [Paenibacillus yanchengensis]|uniref:Alpha/beta hydrolase n=1 Tax=Paenibacillus yanchengensis TaxID=2035833 RepID=A0ABW4YNJ2_9BACL
MKTLQFPLTEDGRVTLTAYIIDTSPEMSNWKQRPAVLVLPGGGYMMTSDREADPVAFHYLSKGFHTFVLRYSVGVHAAFPAPLIDVSRAMALIRNYAEEWHLDDKRVAICGFSAGGHLAASLGTMWHEEQIVQQAGIAPGTNEPNALILGYPVISCADDSEKRLEKMWECAMGEQPYEQMQQQLSCELHVGSHTPPTFLFHTFADNVVPVEHSLLFSQALAKHDIPFELHIYPNGVHGISLANEITSTGRDNLVDRDVAGWVEQSSAWLWRLFGMYATSSAGNKQVDILSRAKLL